MKVEKIYSLVELCSMLNEAQEKGYDQSIINSIAYEIVCRLYVPFSNVSFDDMLLEYGYVNTRENIRGK